MHNRKNIFGISPEIDSLNQLIKKIASSNSAVLINGESGSGKELVANALHENSHRKGDFIPVNCAAIPKELLESELFGHKKGSFTGAFSDRAGRFQLADNGTIFLDEIGDMSLDMQVKLLRVLQEKKIDPIGAMKSVDVNARVVSATHKNLELEVKEGRFREDLFYRLNVLPISIPPLRNRKSDIPELFNLFAKRFGSDEKFISLDEDFYKILQNYFWPGNVRELENLVDRLSTLFPGCKLALNDIPKNMLPKNLLIDINDDYKSNSEFNYSSFLDTKNINNKKNEIIDELFSKTENDQDFDMPNLNVDLAFSVFKKKRSLPSEGLNLKKVLHDFELNLIDHALKESSGNISKTARVLKLQRTTLVEKINKYGLRK